MISLSKSSVIQRSKFVAGTVLLLGIGLVGSQAMQPRSEVTVANPSSFWEGLRISANEAERYDSLAEMRDGADAVVLGRLTNFRRGRQFQGGSEEDIVTHAVVDLKVTDVVSGSVPGELPLEFVIGEDVEAAGPAIERLAAILPNEEYLFFLHRKRGRGEGEYYRLVNSEGLWRLSAGALSAPLAGEEVEGLPEGFTVAPAEVDSEAPSDTKLSPDEIAALQQQALAHRERFRKESGGVSPAPAPSARTKYSAELADVNSLEDLAAKLRR